MADGNISIPSNPSNSVNSSGEIAGASVSGLIQGSMISNMLNKPAYDGKLDKYGEVRLRIGIIDNPTIKRTEEARIDPIDPYNVINMTTGNVTVRWLEQEGGIIRPTEFGDYGQDGETSDREPITLTHPMMWASEAYNWCGIHYMPPVGSVVIVGFRKHNIPVLLGFLQSHYQVVFPLELGEMMLKGFGNNTSHWKMHDEQEHKAWVNKGQLRPVSVLDSPGRKYKWEKSPYAVGLKLRLKAWIDPKNPNDKKEMIELLAYRTTDDGTTSSTIEIKPELITLSSGVDDKLSTVSISPSSVNIKSTGDFLVDVEKNIVFKSNQLHFN